MRVTQHFAEAWGARVGGDVPTSDQIETMIRRSVRVTEQKDATDEWGGFYRVLAAYWVPAENVVLKVDEKSRKAVTVLTAGLAGSWIRRGTGFVPRVSARA